MSYWLALVPLAGAALTGALLLRPRGGNGKQERRSFAAAPEGVRRLPDQSPVPALFARCRVSGDEDGPLLYSLELIPHEGPPLENRYRDAEAFARERTRLAALRVPMLDVRIVAERGGRFCATPLDGAAAELLLRRLPNLGHGEYRFVEPLLSHRLGDTELELDGELAEEIAREWQEAEPALADFARRMQALAEVGGYRLTAMSAERFQDRLADLALDGPVTLRREGLLDCVALQ